MNYRTMLNEALGFANHNAPSCERLIAISLEQMRIKNDRANTDEPDTNSRALDS